MRRPNNHTLMGFVILALLLAVWQVLPPALGVPKFIIPTPFDMVNLARAYSLTRWQIFRKVEFPSTLPNLMAGLRIASTLAVIGVTVGELVGGNTGLGFLISYGGGQANASMVFNAIVLLTLIGIVLYSALVWAEERLLHYIPKNDT